jgi:hypothetical protein
MPGGQRDGAAILQRVVKNQSRRSKGNIRLPVSKEGGSWREGHMECYCVQDWMRWLL